MPFFSLNALNGFYYYIAISSVNFFVVIDLLAIKFRNRCLYFKLKTLLTFVLSKYELFPSTLNNNNNKIVVIMDRVECVCVFHFSKFEIEQIAEDKEVIICTPSSKCLCDDKTGPANL